MKLINIKSLFGLIVSIMLFASCAKEITYKTDEFKGFSGTGESAIWSVYRYTLSDTVYLKAVLAAQTPPQTLKRFDSILNISRSITTSPYALRLYKNGEVAIATKIAQNPPEWTKQTTLKWMVEGDYMNIYRNVNNNWVNVIQATSNLDKIVCKYRRAYWGDTSVNKNLNALEIQYLLSATF